MKPPTRHSGVHSCRADPPFPATHKFKLKGLYTPMSKVMLIMSDALRYDVARSHMGFLGTPSQI